MFKLSLASPSDRWSLWVHHLTVVLATIKAAIGRSLTISFMGTTRLYVSIQLVAPASGDREFRYGSIYATLGFHSIGSPSEWGLCPIKTYTGRAFQAPFARDSHFPPTSPPKSPRQTASNPCPASHRGIERETVIPAIFLIPRSVFLNGDSLPSLGFEGDNLGLLGGKDNFS